MENKYSFNEFDRNLGSLLSKLRKKKGLTQQEVADQLSSEERKIQRSMIRDWENGERKLKAEDVKMLSDFYSVSADVLFGRYEVDLNTSDDNLARALEARHEENGLSNTAKYNVYWMYNNLDSKLVETLNAILESNFIEHFLSTACSAIELGLCQWTTLDTEAEQEYSENRDKLIRLGLFPFAPGTASEMMIELAKKDLGKILEEIIARTGKKKNAVFDAYGAEDRGKEME